MGGKERSKLNEYEQLSRVKRKKKKRMKEGKKEER